MELKNSNEKGLAFKISFFASTFLLFFMFGITIFSYFYFFVSEISNINSQLNSTIKITPASISEAISVELRPVELKTEAFSIKFMTGETIDITTAISQDELSPSVITKLEPVTTLFGVTQSDITLTIDEKQPMFELARDTLIIDRNGNVTTNGIFNFGTFDIDYLANRHPGTFSQFIGNKYYLFKKVVTNDYEIIFTKDVTYVKDFVLKMFVIGIFSSISFFFLVFILSIYFIKLFMKPINEYNTKLKEYNHNLAHEIKTPLTVLNMNLGMLENDENTKIVKSNKEEIEKIKNITDSLLFLSENFTLKEIQKFEINNTIKKFIEANSNQENIFVEYYKKDLEVSANKNMFDRLLKNLIENAFKYSTDKKIKISITEKSILFSNSVEKCISNEEIIKIFEAFYQVDNSRYNSGYGLGLTLVKRITDIFKWKINVACKKNIFKIEIIFKK